MKANPILAVPRTTASIDPTWAWQTYLPSDERPWNRRLAAHLYRRAAFSANHDELSTAEEDGPKKTLDKLFDVERGKTFNEQMVKSSRYLVTGGSVKRLSSWWLLRMLNSPTPFAEKMTLFWHGHFATSGQKVTEVAAMLRQNHLLREHALGKFRPLVQGISRDVAMLTYLDSTENRKTRPNENYARELMELFCLGLDRYTEKDIKEVARCFTGWRVRKVSGAAKFQFNPRQHDTGSKSFLDRHGNFGGEEAIDVILARPSCAEFIAMKLIRFFVFDETNLPRELIAPIATTLRDSDFDIKKAVRQILASNLFFSEHAIGKKIRGPVELAIGFLRQFDATTNLETLAGRLELLGQLPMFPPNVKGWDGGRKWLNSSTILARANLIEDFATLEAAKLKANSYSQWARKNSAPEAGSEFVRWLCDYLLAHEIPHASMQALLDIHDQQAGHEQKIQTVLTAMAVLPEFQLN